MRRLPDWSSRKILEIGNNQGGQRSYIYAKKKEEEEGGTNRRR